MKHLAEFREVVEVVTAAYAVERASAEDVRGMRALLKEGKEWMESGENSVSEFYQWELGMHKELARISRNPIFQWISGTLYRSMEPISFHINKFRAEHFEVLADWEDMIRGLEKGEVMKVTSIMRAHVVKYRRIMEEEVDNIPMD